MTRPLKLLHFADLHLGIERYGQIDPATGASTRLADFLRVFDLIIDTAIAEEVDAILFAGDAYKNRDPSPTHQREFARRLRRIVEAGIPIILLVGNHDLPYAWGRATSIEIFEALAVPGVTIADRLATITVETRSGPLQIVTLPWVTRSILLGREELRGAGMEEVQHVLHEAVVERLAEQAAALDRALPAVLLAHATIQGASYGSERSVMLGQDLIFTRNDLAADHFHYVALGHIHKHQSVSQHPPIVYAGSPERIDFGEEHEEKGFVLVDLAPAAGGWQATPCFRPLPARRFQTLRLRAFGSDPQGDLIRLIERSGDLKETIVRLLIDMAPEAEGQVRPIELRRALRLAGVAHVAAIRLESTSIARARLPIAAQTELAPQQMLQHYLEAKRVPIERARKLLELAEGLAAEIDPEQIAAPAPTQRAPSAPTRPRRAQTSGRSETEHDTLAHGREAIERADPAG